MAEPTDFRGPTRVGSHAYARGLAGDGHEVMWVGTPIYPHQLVGADAYTRRRRRHSRRPGTGYDGITEYYPLTWLPVVDRPLLRSRFAVENTLRFTVPRFERVMRRRGFTRPGLLWLSQSRFSLPVLRRVSADKSCYRMSDDWAHFDNVPRALIDAEREILERIDVVFVSSRRLQESVSEMRPDAVYLPNGVDDAFFAAPGREPAILEPFPRPRIVFVGSLLSWVDFSLINAVATRCPAASVVLVGPGKLPSIMPPNTHVTGPVPYESVPNLLQHCDLGIIPFEKSPLTDAASPVKLFEYLAAGLPVVATRLDEIDRLDPPVGLANNRGDFADLVAKALESPGAPDGRRQFARDHTWARRMDIVRSTLGI